MYEARLCVYDTLECLIRFELLTKHIRDMVDKFLDNFASNKDLRIKIQKQTVGNLVKITEHIISNVETLRDKYRLFSKVKAISTKGNEVTNVMAYKRRDVLKYVGKEYNSIKRLVQVADIGDLPAFLPHL